MTDHRQGWWLLAPLILCMAVFVGCDSKKDEPKPADSPPAKAADSTKETPPPQSKPETKKATDQAPRGQRELRDEQQARDQVQRQLADAQNRLAALVQSNKDLATRIADLEARAIAVSFPDQQTAQAK